MSENHSSSHSQSGSRSRLDPEALPRRDFLGLASIWAAGSTAVFATLGMLRLPKAAVLSSPSRKYRVTLPENLAEGTPFLPAGRSVALFRDKQGVYAVSTTCTHLGCVIKPSPTGFDCPCHGSRFAPDGKVIKGPAPAPLPWRKVQLDGAVCIVDEGASVPHGTKV